MKFAVDRARSTADVPRVTAVTTGASLR